MVEISQIQEWIISQIPDAKVEAMDLTGTKDHFRIFVSSPSFKGKRMVEQHQLILKALGPYMGDGKPLHAVELKTFEE